MTAMAAPVRETGQPALGVISIAGSRTQPSIEYMQTLAPALLQAAELAVTREVSAWFGRRRWGRLSPTNH